MAAWSASLWCCAVLCRALLEEALQLERQLYVALLADSMSKEEEGEAVADEAAPGKSALAKMLTAGPPGGRPAAAQGVLQHTAVHESTWRIVGLCAMAVRAVDVICQHDDACLHMHQVMYGPLSAPRCTWQYMVARCSTCDPCTWSCMPVHALVGLLLLVGVQKTCPA